MSCFFFNVGLIWLIKHMQYLIDLYFCSRFFSSPWNINKNHNFWIFDTLPILHPSLPLIKSRYQIKSSKIFDKNMIQKQNSYHTLLCFIFIWYKKGLSKEIIKYVEKKNTFVLIWKTQELVYHTKITTWNRLTPIHIIWINQPICEICM